MGLVRADCHAALHSSHTLFPGGNVFKAHPPLRQTRASVCRREQIAWLERLEQQGWELHQPMQDDHGWLRRELPAESSGDEGQ